MLLLLSENSVNADIKILSDAWDSQNSFLLIPNKDVVSEEWLNKSLAEIPGDLLKNHFLLLTSGSTGQPKIIVANKKRAESLCQTLHLIQESIDVNSTVCLLPITYSYAFINQWLWAKVHSRKFLKTIGLSSPETLKEALLESKDSMVCLTGAQVPIIDQYFHGSRFDKVIRVHFAGGRFPQERILQIKEMFPNGAVFNNYGCAEAMPRLTIRRAEQSDNGHHVGWPIPGVQVKSDDSDNILFKSNYRAVAVVDKNGFKRIDDSDWIPTGDLGRIADGGHLELIGRANDVFKRYGEKISIPLFLESIRLCWPAQAECFVEKDRLGELGCVLLLSPQPSEAQIQIILQKISERFRRVYWPLQIGSIANLPLLHNGKVDRNKLSESKDLIIHWRQRI